MLSVRVWLIAALVALYGAASVFAIRKASESHAQQGASAAAQAVSAASATPLGALASAPSASPTPSRRVKRAFTRSVPISTRSPVPLYFPNVGGDLHSGKLPMSATRLYYLGQGAVPQTTVYAMAAPGPSGEYTNYMYAVSTEVSMQSVYRTATINSTTITGYFDVSCNMGHGLGQEAQCFGQYRHKSGSQTATDPYTTYLSTFGAMTTFTPVQGMVEAERQKTASGPRGMDGITSIPGSSGAVPSGRNWGSRVSSDLCFGTTCVPAMAIQLCILLSSVLAGAALVL